MDVQDYEQNVPEESTEPAEAEKTPAPMPDVSVPTPAAGSVLPSSLGAPGDLPTEEGPAWYVIHCYSGYENKVRHNLEQRIETMGMKDKIFDVSFRPRKRSRSATANAARWNVTSSPAMCWSIWLLVKSRGMSFAIRRA